MCKEKNLDLRNEEFERREYELLRHVLFAKQDVDHELLDKKIDQILRDEEYLKYVVELTEDSFGKTYLRGMATAALIINNFKWVKPEIRETLLENLFFGYHDEEENIPLVLTGRVFGMTYLEGILYNDDIALSEKYFVEIAKHLSSQDEVNYEMITLFLIRDDIPFECKKEVIDSLGDNELEKLEFYWEETCFENFMLGESFDGDIYDMMEFLENTNKEKYDRLVPVIQLIEDRIW